MSTALEIQWTRWY